MAVVNFGGFETGDFSEVSSVVGGAAVSVTGAASRWGAYGMRIQTTNAAYVVIRGLSVSGTPAAMAESAPYLVFDFRVVSWHSGGHAIVAMFGTWDVLRASISLYADTGEIDINDADGHCWAGSDPGVIALNTWYRIGVYLSGGAAEQTCTVQVNGVTRATHTGDVFLDDIVESYRLGDCVGAIDESIHDYDAWIIDGAGWPSQTARVGLLVPNDDGTHLEWGAPGDYLLLDEVPHDGGTTKIATDVPGIETCAMQNASSLGSVASVAAVKGIIIITATGIGTKQRAQMYQGDVHIDTNILDPAVVGTYEPRALLRLASPAENAWTPLILNDIHMGVSRTGLAAGIAYCTAVYLDVLWESDGAGVYLRADKAVERGTLRGMERRIL